MRPMPARPGAGGSRPRPADSWRSHTVAIGLGSSSWLVIFLFRHAATVHDWPPIWPLKTGGLRGHFIDSATFVTVSYTHLRAHETRHDLVCRLLLEKKK